MRTSSGEGLRSAALAAWMLLAVICATSSGAQAAEHAHSPHGRSNTASGVLSLDVYPDAGELHLLLGRRDEAGERTLWYRRSRDGGTSWSRPVRVDAGLPPPRTFRRGNDAQIA